MKINRLKINSYGKLKEKEINLKDHINVIYGKNESGKSTLLNFIIGCFYGISKNKNGKEISNLEKYTPWSDNNFSGKLEYELDNKQRYEVFRDFKKKNPQIFNSEMEDISKQFNIDKSKGNEFFYEQTKVDENLFLSTVLVNQDEVKLEKQNQNILIQKIANLVGTGEDNVSFKKAIDRIDKRRLDEIGTERSREKPINLISKELQRLEEEKQETEKYLDLKYNIEENINVLNKEIQDLESQNQFLKQIKLINENGKIEDEKINLKEDLRNDNIEKITLLKNEINEIKANNKNIFEKIDQIKSKKDKLNKKILVIFIIAILISILQFIFIKNKYFNYGFLFIFPIILVYYLFLKRRINDNEKKVKNNLEKTNLEISNLESEINLIETSNSKLEKEITELRNNFNLNIDMKIKEIRNNYINVIEKSKLDILMKLEDNNLEIQNIENKLNDKKIQLHTIKLDYKNIESKLENLSKVEENIFDNQKRMESLLKLEKSMILAKEVLSTSYEKMKNIITPKFTQELSKTISEITNGKYNNVKFNDTVGLIVETESGNYMPISRLSVGTIDQLYLSLRLSMTEDLSEEKMPIILDETFAYYDTERLENILKYLDEKFYSHQIIIFTCTNREKELLEKLKISYNFIEM